MAEVGSGRLVLFVPLAHAWEYALTPKRAAVRRPHHDRVLVSLRRTKSRWRATAGRGCGELSTPIEHYISDNMYV